jgi:hypothetical protein
MSKEHIIADWVGRVIDREENTNFASWSRISQPRPSQFQIDEDSRLRNRPLGANVIRRVCKSCNNGWMKDIQDEAIPALTPLMTGDWTKLVHEQCGIIVQWAVMTSINLDTSNPNRSVVTQLERTHFMTSKSIPSSWLCFIGIATGRRLDVYQRTIEVHHLVGEGSEPQCQNISLVTIQVGNLLFHTVLLRSGVIRLDPLGYGLSTGLIPVSPTWSDCHIDWRSAPLLSTDCIARIQDGFADTVLEQIDAPWKTEVIRNPNL